MALLWCEARCVGLYDDNSTNCRETAPGAFGTREAEKMARRDGWRVANDEWICPVCQKRRNSN